MSPFWRVTLEAAAWTFLQVFVVSFGAALGGITPEDWPTVLSAALSAFLAAIGAVLSLVKSLVFRNAGVEDDTPFLSG